jgi:hypothetical protein
MALRLLRCAGGGSALRQIKFPQGDGVEKCLTSKGALWGNTGGEKKYVFLC